MTQNSLTSIRWRALVMALLQLISFSAATEVAATDRFQKVCQLWGNPILELERVNGTLRLVNNSNADDGDSSIPSHLRQRRLDRKSAIDWTQKKQRNQDQSGDDAKHDNILRVRECRCCGVSRAEATTMTAPATYYPIVTNRCGVPFPDDPDQTVVCFTATTSVTLVRGVTIFTLIGFFLILLFLRYTQTGRSALDFMARLCRPDQNGALADRLLRDDPERARHMIRQHVEHHRVQSERQRGQYPRRQHRRRRRRQNSFDLG